MKLKSSSGEDEAKWGFIGGAYNKSNLLNPDDKICLIDIGGGSTEISLGTLDKSVSNTKVNGKSLNVGSVRLKEKYLNEHPPTYESIVKAENFIDPMLAQLKESDKFYESYKSSNLIGIAGTITTLAAIKHGLTSFDASVVDRTILTLNEIETIFSRLASMPLEELYALGNYMEGRADIIIPGILILKTFMEKFGFHKITVSTKGLRYGIFLREVYKTRE